MTLNEYAQEVFDYMAKKLPDINQATLLEIVEFFAMKSNNFVSDKIEESNKEWRKEFDRYDKKWQIFIAKFYK